MPALQLLICFLAYTILWMVFCMVLISNQTNRPVFGKRRDEEDEFEDFSQLPASDRARILEKAVGTGGSFNMPSPEDRGFDGFDEQYLPNDEFPDLDEKVPENKEVA